MAKILFIIIITILLIIYILATGEFSKGKQVVVFVTHSNSRCFWFANKFLGKDVKALKDRTLLKFEVLYWKLIKIQIYFLLLNRFGFQFQLVEI